MYWYKIESKNILLPLQKYFIVLLTMFTFSQQIVGGNISEEEIKAKFEEIKQKQICSCCINFKDSDMQFAIALSQTNKELNRTNEEQQKLLEEDKKQIIEIIEELREMEDKKNENENELEKKLEQKDEIINGLENEKNKILNKKNELNGQLEGKCNELKELNEKYEKNEEKLKENEEKLKENNEKIKKYENEKTQIVNEKNKLNVQLEEKCKELNELNELNKKYKENEEKYKENDKKINEYKNEINKCKEEINQISIENKNLNEQIKNFSSNVNDVDLMKFQQKADENKSREILNIFNDKTPGQALTDTGIFYLPFKFLGDEKKISIKSNHYYKESGIKDKIIVENTSNYKDSKEENSLGNNKKIKSNKENLNTPAKGKDKFKKIVPIQNKENTRNVLTKTGNLDIGTQKFIKRDISKNSSFISEETEESKEDIKIRDNEFYLRANSAFPGGYNVLTLGSLNKIIFSRYSVEKRIEYPTVNIDTLKKLYLINEGATWIRNEEVKKNKEVKNNEKEKNKEKDKKEVKNKNKEGNNKEVKNKNKEENKEENNKEVKNKNKEENKEENNYIIKTQESFTGRKDFSVEFSSKCFYESNKNISIECSKVKNMDIDDNTMKKINLNYKDYIDFVDINEYLAAENKKEYFLLKLDLKDPECIALLQQVGKGNYGVVKKALIFENNRYVPKAIKFTCVNNEYENATEENIKKEIFAGRVARLVDPDNIAYVQNYMTINNFISRKNNIEEEKITLPEVWEEYLSQDHYEKFQEDKQNIKKCFENNVFKGNNKISGPLYIMIMDLINGDDLFKNNNIDINVLGDVLSKVLINCFSKVALNDIKAKNIILNKRKNKFSIIDIQTLEKTTSDLSDPLGTPEYWPFFKTLNINFENFKNVGEDNLLNIYCNTIDNNFVDTYAACMTMYFTKFHTFTAAGLLTLLFKWMVLEEENKGKEGWVEFSLDRKIKFLQEYEKNYKEYINFVSGDKDHIIKNLVTSYNNISNYDQDEDNNINKINPKKNNSFNISAIKFFFENIDDRNLNKTQKNELADLLKNVISSKNESDIFYLLDEIKKKIILVNKDNLKEKEKEKKKEEEKEKKKEEKKKEENENKKEKEKKKEEKTDEEKIITFYRKCIEEDFKNFATLSKSNCRYDDFMKYILCFGSCLNYNNSQNISNAEDFLKTIELKKEFGKNEEKFFKSNIEKTINNLVSGFNQKFINDLLKIFPLDKYYEITKSCINDKQMLEYSLKKSFQDLIKNEDDLNKRMKAFYLLHLLEKQNALHVPRNLIKSFSLIKEKKHKHKNK